MRVSVTEMATWQECRLKWWYRYQYGIQGALSPEMLLGSATHLGIETLLRYPQQPTSYTIEKMEHYLVENGGNKQFTSAKMALLGVPPWVWQLEGAHVEERMEVERQDCVFIGKPDLWWEDENGITVVDFKTTSGNIGERLEAYELWVPQLPRYAAMLSTTHQTPVFWQYIVLGTRGLGVAGARWPVRADEVWKEMEGLAGEMADCMDTIVPHKSYACGRCEFAKVDEVRFSGGEWKEVAKSMSREGKR